MSGVGLQTPFFAMAPQLPLPAGNSPCPLPISTTRVWHATLDATGISHFHHMDGGARIRVEDALPHWEVSEPHGLHVHVHAHKQATALAALREDLMDCPYTGCDGHCEVVTNPAVPSLSPQVPHQAKA